MGREDLIEYNVTMIPGGSLPAYPTLAAASKVGVVGIGIIKVLCWVDAAIVRLEKDFGNDPYVPSWEEHLCLSLGP